ncbi:unnamed protein product [Plutella xylostella]|uniref:Small ribosomal subunit protein uS17 n=1 Tax=Plutella xylostella TaxID=51655 RepID=A0A8S4GI40_PLUXY|nr:unnamed protein product [Plutella xylostella]
MRHSKSVGLGFKTPREAIEGTTLTKVPVHRQRVHPWTHPVRSCAEDEDAEDHRHPTRLPALCQEIQQIREETQEYAVHLSPCFRDVELGDIVTIGECRPLSRLYVSTY